MTHRAFKPAKPGLVTQQILRAKALRCHFGDVEHMEEYAASHHCVTAHWDRLKYSEQGDFTRAYRGGFV